MKRVRMTFSEWCRLLFVRAQVRWDHDEKLVTKFKVLGDKVYILKQEPIAYGDPRNAQIDRFS